MRVYIATEIVNSNCIHFCMSRQAVEDSYNDLQSQIESCRVQHAASMALFSRKMEEAKKQNNNMSDRVSCVHCSPWMFTTTCVIVQKHQHMTLVYPYVE